MPYNPGGLFSLVASYFANPGTTIRTEQHNPVFEDVGAALSQVLLRDGRAPMTGPLNMNGQPINNVAVGSSSDSVATLGQAMPIGAMIDFAGPSAPTGWALCYGQALSRATYATLYALIGTTYGSGDGSTTFNLPDARGSVIAGYDVMGGVAANKLPGSVAAAVGLRTATLTQPNLPNINFTVIPSPHVHTVNQAQGTGQSRVAGSGNPADPLVLNGITQVPASSEPANAASTVNSGGSSTPIAIVQPTLILNKIIRVSYDA